MNRTLLIHKGSSNQWEPVSDMDTPAFIHCTGGSISVTDITQHLSTFFLHNISIEIKE